MQYILIVLRNHKSITSSQNKETVPQNDPKWEEKRSLTRFYPQTKLEHLRTYDATVDPIL